MAHERLARLDAPPAPIAGFVQTFDPLSAFVDSPDSPYHLVRMSF